MDAGPPPPPVPVEPRRLLGAETDPTRTPRVAIRTRFFDDFLRRLASERPLSARQLALLGCGLDSRAFRLDCLQAQGPLCCDVFELEPEPLLRYKEAVLRSLGQPSPSDSPAKAGDGPPRLRCRRRVALPADLTQCVTRPVTAAVMTGVGNRSLPCSTSDSPSPKASSPPSATAPPSSLQLPLSEWAHSLLTKTSFRRHVPSVWLLEGCLMYLTHEQ